MFEEAGGPLRAPLLMKTTPTSPLSLSPALRVGTFRRRFKCESLQPNALASCSSFSTICVLVIDQGWQALLSSRKLSATQTVCMKPPPPLYLCISGFSDSPTVPTVLTLLPLVLSQLLFAAQSRKGRRTRPSLNPTPQDECWVRVRVLMGRWHLVGNPAISG